MIEGASAQQAGTLVPESPPVIPFKMATAPQTAAAAVLDANWRWVHKANGYKGCLDASGHWDQAICPDPHTCARNCALEGVDLDKYRTQYGVWTNPASRALVLTHSARHQGSRLFLTSLDRSKYLMLHLLGKTLRVEVDVSRVPCGLNAALYLVGIDERGNYGENQNRAGAGFGTGYGDAQSPKDNKFVEGTANLKQVVGVSAVEIDVLEANRHAMAWAVHPCRNTGTCHGEICAHRCDKEGSDMNPYRQGYRDFFGPNKTLDSTRPFVVEMTFVSDDGGASLAEIRQSYRQDGRRFSYPGGATMTPEFIARQDALFGRSPRDGFLENGGFRTVTEALRKGMVLVFSIWKDPATNMKWLDGAWPPGADERAPGVLRGPCPRGSVSLRGGAAAAEEGLVVFSSVEVTGASH